MGTLTIRMPDATHERLRQLARARKVSVNKLIEEFSTAALAEFDAETRFLARAARGTPARGLALLDRLDATATAEKRERYKVRAAGAKGSKVVKRAGSSR
jgi:predicted transcriptional regulator